MTLSPLISGVIMDEEKTNSENYFYTYIYFLGLECIVLIFGILIYFYDRNHGNRLNSKKNKENNILN